MDANEQKARELLAAEYAKAYAEPFGAPIDSHAIAVRVIAKALAQHSPPTASLTTKFSRDAERPRLELVVRAQRRLSGAEA